eukprot:3602293-Prymnesium_polylepis.1
MNRTPATTQLTAGRRAAPHVWGAQPLRHSVGSRQCRALRAASSNRRWRPPACSCVMAAAASMRRAAPHSSCVTRTAAGAR